MQTTLGNLLLDYHEYFPTDYRDWLQQLCDEAEGEGKKDHGSGAWERLRSRFQGRSPSLAPSHGWGSPKRSKPAAFEFFWDDLWN